jgi:chromosome segregation ATPase
MSLELTNDARSELAALAQTLAENPQTRKEFLRLTKQVKPDLPIPELEIEEKVSQSLTASEQRVQQLEAKLAERDALEKLKERRQSLKEKGLIENDSDIDEVEKLMVEKKIADHETAAQYHQWMKQAAAPTPTGYNPQVINKFDLNAYWKNPANAARSEAAKALNELRQPRRPIGL